VFLTRVEVQGIVEGVWGGRKVDVVDAGTLQERSKKSGERAEKRLCTAIADKRL